MYYIKEDMIRRNVNLTLNDTYKFDELPETGKSAGLLLVLKSPTNSGQHLDYTNYGDKLRFADWFDKIQVVTDGKRPLKDLNGILCQALEYWNTGKVAKDRYIERSIGADTCYIPISWGRFLGDIEYYLQWEDYSSIELDLKNVLTSPPYASATLDIINMKIEGEGAVPSSKGVFQERIWREYTTVADETKYLKPPVGNKYRRIILQAIPAMTTAHPYHRARSFWYLMNEIKLGFKEKTELFFDAYGLELLEKNAQEFPELPRTCGQSLGCRTTQPGTVTQTSIGRRQGQKATPMEITTDIVDNHVGIYPYSEDIMNILDDVATNNYEHWEAYGMGYMNTLALLFDRFGMDNIMDSMDKQPITLDIKTENNANAAGGTNKIILSELVSK